MHVIACAAPSGAIEPAPLTSLPIIAGNSDAELSGFWAADDRYYVRMSELSGRCSWFRIESGAPMDMANDVLTGGGSIAGVVSDIGERNGGVAFPTGSTGRFAFRVWRAKGSESQARTRILAVRAARSRRLPA